MRAIDAGLKSMPVGDCTMRNFAWRNRARKMVNNALHHVENGTWQIGRWNHIPLIPTIESLVFSNRLVKTNSPFVIFSRLILKPGFT